MTEARHVLILLSIFTFTRTCSIWQHLNFENEVSLNIDRLKIYMNSIGSAKDA